MIQVKNVVDGLFGLIGWRKDLSDDISIDSSLTSSESGLYYQDAHPLLTLKNLKSIAPDFSNRKWDEYDNDKTYHKDDIVALYGDSENAGYDLYRCVSNEVSGQNPSSSESWSLTDPFSLWLYEKIRASISNAVSRFIYSVMPKGGTKSILEHKLLFSSVSRLADRVKSGNRIVGLEIHPIHTHDVCVRLHRVGLQALVPNDMQRTGNIGVHVKSSNDMLGDIISERVEVGGYSAKWLAIDSDIANTEGGQSLYAYYMQEELSGVGMEAINRVVDWSKAPCQSCHSADYQAYLAWSKYIEVWPFYVANQNFIDIDGRHYTFDQQDMIYVNNTNYGLNLEISVYCDYTDFIIRNKGEFISLLQKQMAADMLKEFAYNANVRANRNSVNASRTDIMAALDGTSDSVGLVKELDDMYKGLNFSMKGLDKVCRPCANNGLRYTTT